MGANLPEVALGASASAAACLPCPDNSNSNAGSTAVTDCTCNAGFAGQQPRRDDVAQGRVLCRGWERSHGLERSRVRHGLV
eukprot:1561078-Rhodomonas_salina.1